MAQVERTRTLRANLGWLMRPDSDSAPRADGFFLAFPASRAKEVAEAVAVMPPAEYGPLGSYSVRVQGEPLEIPMRIYNPEPPGDLERGLSTTQRTVLHCLYTRHHDGFVRQRHLQQTIASEEPWTVPFVVQLIGEYVLEIVIDIRDALTDLDVLGSSQQMRFGAFIAENPAFFELTSQRVMSYWNCYYRDRQRSTYPGFSLLSSLRTAAEQARAAA